MIRVLAVGDKLDGLMYQLAEERGVIVDYAYDDPDLARRVMQRGSYDLVVLEPDMLMERAGEIARMLKGVARNRCCIVAPRTDMIGYEKSDGGVDFVVSTRPKRCIEAYRIYMDGSDGL